MLCSERLLLLPRPDATRSDLRSTRLLLLHPPKILHLLLHTSPPPPALDDSDHGRRSSCSTHALLPTKCPPSSLILENLAPPVSPPPPSSPDKPAPTRDNPLPFVTQPDQLDDAEPAPEDDLQHPPPRVMEVRYEESRAGHYRPFEAAVELDAGRYGVHEDSAEWTMPAGKEDERFNDDNCTYNTQQDREFLLPWSIPEDEIRESQATSAYIREAAGDGTMSSSSGILEAWEESVGLDTDRSKARNHFESIREAEDRREQQEGGACLNGRVIHPQSFHDNRSASAATSDSWHIKLNGPSHHQMQEPGISDMAQTNQSSYIKAHEGKPAAALVEYTSAPSTSPFHGDGSDSTMMMIRMPTYRAPFSRVSEITMFLESLGADCSRIFREDPTAATDCEVQVLRQLVAALEGYGLEWKELGRIFNLCPRILRLSPIALESVATFLFDEVGLRRRDFGKVIKRCPRLLTCRVDEQLRPTLEFLKSLGFRNMGAVVSNNATLLSFSAENKIIPKLKYLESLGFAQNEVASMVIRFPAIFNYSAKENLQPKYEYLVRVMGRRNRDLVSFPQYFGFSLARKIRPRFECIARRGASLSLQAMLKISDAEFSAKFGCGVADRAAKDIASPLSLTEAAGIAKLSDLTSHCSMDGCGNPVGVQPRNCLPDGMDCCEES